MTTVPEALGFLPGWDKRAEDRMKAAAVQMTEVWANLTEEVERKMDDPTVSGADLIGFIFGAAFGMGFAMGELES
jgi:hypothetical protein